jgi:hypothetical protein
MRRELWQHRDFAGDTNMADASIRAYLAQHPFFKGLSAEYLDVLTSHATELQVAPQQRVFKQDTDADKFYIVRQGKVGLEIPAISGEPLRVQTVGDSQLLGWSWLIPPFRWLFDARAIVPSTLIATRRLRRRSKARLRPAPPLRSPNVGTPFRRKASSDRPVLGQLTGSRSLSSVVP